MTDAPAKPVRVRCPNCKISYFNDPIDRDSHTRYCPVTLVKRIKALESENDDLTRRLEDLERDEPPAFDLDDVEELPADDSDLISETAEQDDEPKYQAKPDAPLTPFVPRIYTSGSALS